MRVAQIAEGAPSLRSDFSWTLAGNVVYAASQWAVLSLTAKLGGAEMLGQYALAVAVTAPVAMLAHLNLRAVLATDVARIHPFGDYLAARLTASAAGLVAIAWLAVVSGRSRGLALAILLVGVAQTSEAFSDLLYGAMQRRGEMPLIGRSMIARGVLSVCVFGAALYKLRDLSAALAAMVVARLAILLAYDWPRGVAGDSVARSRPGAMMPILRAALPLGLVLLLVSLTTNLPRYAVEQFLGVPELGVFAGVAAIATVGSTVANALGQSATHHLASHAAARRRSDFLRLTVQLAAWMFVLGLTGVLAAAIAGPAVLSLLYRREFAAHGGLLLGIMGAATLGYVAIALGFALTAARAFDAQVPLLCLVAASCAAGSWLLVPQFGLGGAAISLAIAACVQICGQALLLHRALRRMAVAQ